MWVIDPFANYKKQLYRNKITAVEEQKNSSGALKIFLLMFLQISLGAI